MRAITLLKLFALIVGTTAPAALLNNGVLFSIAGLLVYAVCAGARNWVRTSRKFCLIDSYNLIDSYKKENQSRQTSDSLKSAHTE